jgi:hypothetical protein
MDRKRLTRREFLEIVAQQSVGAKIVATALLSSPYIGTAEGQSAIDLDVSGLEALIAIVDEIIPAVDGMPAASQVGTLAYFELLAGKDPELARTLQRGVTVVEDLSRERLSARFRTLSKGQRVEVLSELEKTGEAGLFTSLQNYVYEAYYLEPRVWELLGYEPHPTNSQGPQMEPFDEALLGRVREMAQLYKEVP